MSACESDHLCAGCDRGEHAACDGYAWCIIAGTAPVCMCYAGAENGRYLELHPGRRLT